MRPVPGIFRFAALVPLLGGMAFGEEITAARTLPAGTVLRASDLHSPELRKPAVSELVEAMIGLQARRAIFAGNPVKLEDLGPATLVDRNEIVTMRYENGQLGIRAEGRSLEPGGLGQRIRVINLDSRASITAVVAGPGLVEVMQ